MDSLAGTSFHEFWVGDSHAPTILGAPLQRVTRVQGRKAICVWVGPRLMHSIARDGVSSPITHFTRMDRRGRLVAVFGEIDCRIHLARHPERTTKQSLAWVSDYWAALCSLASQLKLTEIAAIGPLPPSDLGADSSQFPRVGSLLERAKATEILTQALIDSSPDCASVIDAQLLVGDHEGVLLPRYTDDGVHVNHIGASEIRKALDS